MIIDNKRRKTDGSVIQFPTFDASVGEAYSVVKYSLDDVSISDETKILAIEKIAEMETINGIKKDELINALRWIFAHYDFRE